MDILQPYQSVRSHRNSVTMRDEYGALSFLNQTERRSRTRSDTHVHNRQGQNCDRKHKYDERSGDANARKLRCAVSQGEKEREGERRRQRRVPKILMSSLFGSSCPFVACVGSFLLCASGTMHVVGVSGSARGSAQ